MAAWGKAIAHNRSRSVMLLNLNPCNHYQRCCSGRWVHAHTLLLHVLQPASEQIEVPSSTLCIACRSCSCRLWVCVLALAPPVSPAGGICAAQLLQHPSDWTPCQRCAWMIANWCWRRPAVHSLSVHRLVSTHMHLAMTPVVAGLFYATGGCLKCQCQLAMVTPAVLYCPTHPYSRLV
jgi:hypothetical protein